MRQVCGQSGDARLGLSLGARLFVLQEGHYLEIRVADRVMNRVLCQDYDEAVSRAKIEAMAMFPESRDIISCFAWEGAYWDTNDIGEEIMIRPAIYNSPMRIGQYVSA